MNILTALKTTLAAFPQTERRVALTQFLSRYVDTKARITNYRCIGKDADAIDMFLRSVGMDESVYTIVRSKFDNDTALIKWNTASTERIVSFVKNVGRAMTTNCLTKLYAGIVLEPNEESVVQNIDTSETTTEHWSKNIQEITDDIFGGGTNVHFATLGEIERHAWENNLFDPSVQLPPIPLFMPRKDGLARDDVSVRYMKTTDSLTFMPGLTTAPLRALLAATSESNPLNNFLYQDKGYLSGVNDLSSRNHLLVVTTGWVRTIDRLHAMKTIEFLSNPKKLWAYISMLYRMVYKVQCTVTPWSRVAVNNIRTQSSGPYPTILRKNNEWGTIRCDVDYIENTTQLAVLASVILTPCSTSCTSVKSGYANVPDTTPIPLATPDKTQATNDANDSVNNQNYLAASDLGAEWFATVHGIYMDNNTGTRTERIENFRKMCSTINPVRHTDVSKSSILRPTRDEPGLVFVSGCAIALREFFNKNGELPEFHEGAQSIITDMYSGIITDNSVSMATYLNGEKDSFPNVTLVASKACSSSFLGSLDTEDGSKVQLRVAPRKDTSSSRSYAIVLKTTLKASTFLNVWRNSPSSVTSDVISTIARSFLNAYIFCGDDPTAAAGLNTPPPSYATQMVKNLLSEFDLPCPSEATDAAMTHTHVLNSVELSAFDSPELSDRSTYVSLTLLPDSDDRLYLAIIPPLSFTITARLMYRSRSGLPIATQSLARKLNQVRSSDYSPFTVYVPDSEPDSRVYYDKYIAEIMKNKWFNGSQSESYKAGVLMAYPDNNLDRGPETSILMDLWGTMYFKKYLNETGLNAPKGESRHYLPKSSFANIAGDEAEKGIKVGNIVFGP